MEPRFSGRARRPPCFLLLLAAQLLGCWAANPSNLQHARGAQQPYVPRIPADLNKWVYKDASNPESKHEGAVERRFWDRAALQRAIGAVNYEQLRPFLAKLNRGQPVTVVAFGDSITASHAGCFHRDEAHLRQHMKVLGSTYMRGHCVSTFKWHWAASFMSIINATWPHRDHIMINNGIPATALTNFADGVCLEYQLPDKADLLLLEHLPSLESGDVTLGIERLLHRLQLHFNSRMPAVVFFNMHRALHNGLPNMTDSDKCIRDRRLCPTLCPNNFKNLPEPASQGSLMELRTHALARYYGFTSFSHGTLVHGLLRDRWHSRLNMSECEMFSTLYKDMVHPSDTGRLLMADLLTDYLASAEAYLGAQAQDPLFRPALHAGQLQPRQPLRNESLLVAQMRCYGSMTSAVMGGVGSGEEVMSLQVLQSQGWEFVEYDSGGDAGEKKYKPGWIATEPGALLRIELDTQFAGAKSVLVQLSYLTSYEHMGAARASCVEGCSCQEATLDALVKGEHHSVPKVHALRATPSSRCVVQLEVLDELQRAEHKFKLLQVVVSTTQDASKRLAELQRAELQRAELAAAGVSASARR